MMKQLLAPILVIILCAGPVAGRCQQKAGFQSQQRRQAAQLQETSSKPYSYFDKDTNETWTSFQVPGTRFFVNLPGIPEHKPTKTRDGSPADEYTLQVGNRTFTVGCVSLGPTDVVNTDLLVGAAEHAGNVYGKTASRKVVRNHGLTGGEAFFEVDDPKLKGPYEGIVDYFTDDKHVVYFVAQKPKPVVDRESAMFFVSIRSADHWPPPKEN